jgi:hypothetical protein
MHASVMPSMMLAASQREEKKSLHVNKNCYLAKYTVFKETV